MGVFSALFGDPNAGLKESQGTINDYYGQALAGLDVDSAKADYLLKQGQQANQDIARQGDRLNEMGSAGSRLNMAEQFRQDANRYETDQATQGVLNAYGDNPLDSGVSTGIAGALAQLARQNYGSALDRANAATGQNQQTGLGNMQVRSGNNQNYLNQGLANNHQYADSRANLLTAQGNSLASAQQAQADDGGLIGNINKAIGAFT